MTARRIVPWIALVLLTLVAGSALLSLEHVPGGFDTAFHFWRAVQAERLLREGVLIPRWAPDMARGYGYPLFIFQGALSAQLAALLRLAGLPWAGALNGAYFLGMLGAACTLFLLGRRIWGAVGGWSAAAALLFAPYYLYVVYYRGSLSETVAWVFPPLVLWAITTWARGRREGLLIGAAALAGLALAHPVSLYLFAPLFILWMLAESLGRESGERRAALLRGMGLLVLGGALSVFAWGPGLAERDAVHLGQATAAWVFDYRANFLPLRQLLALPRRADPYLINDWPERGLGLVYVLVGMGAALGWPMLSRRERWRLAVLGLMAGAGVFLATSSSRFLWDALPFLAAFQFPWRWLAPATLALSLIVGSTAECLAARFGPRGPLVGLCLLTVAHWGWLYPPQGTLPGPPTPAGMIAWELATDTVGTTASNEFMPRGATLPPRDNPVTMALLAGETPRRLDPASLPPGASAVEDGGVLRITSPRDFTAHYRVFYYPGWRVTIDGAVVPTFPALDTGWLTFSVPAGEHTVAVRFGESTLRRQFAEVSAVTLALLLGLWEWLWFQHPLPQRRRVQIAPLWLPALAVGLVALKFLVADPLPVLWRSTRWRDGALVGVTQPRDVNFGGRARLLGLDPLPAAFPADAEPLLTLYWQALQPRAGDWHVGVAFEGRDGTRWSPHLRPERWRRSPPPLLEWPADAYARMDYHVIPPAGMPPGEYTVWLSFFDRRTLEPASVLGADGNPLGPELALGTVEITRPRRTPDLAALGVTAPDTRAACAGLGLWAVSADRGEAAPGGVVALRWVWEATAEAQSPVSVTLALRDAAGEMARAWALPPAAAWWPVSAWEVGERWVGQPVVRLPGGLESGEYALEVSLPACAEPLAALPLTIRAPERAWEVPDDLAPRADDFAGQVRLAGAGITPEQVAPGERLEVRLAWQALAEMETAYHVFVHVVGADGTLLAQSDGEPAVWARPTTGWAVGEVVAETRTLAIPAGDSGPYEVRVGLYVPGGARLLTDAGADAVVVAP